MELSYRPIEKDDRAQVLRLGRRAFGPTVAMALSLEHGGHVAELGGAIVGATILKCFAVGKRRIGLVSWIMTAPQAQGQGVGARLLELSDEWFQAEGADETIAMIEGYNQSSSKLFRSRGYARLPVARQLRLFGFGVLAVWLKSFLVVAAGHDLWYRGASATGDSGRGEPAASLGSFAGCYAFHAVLTLLLTFRWGVTAPPGPRLAIAALVPLAILGVRTGSFALVARIAGMRVRYAAPPGGALLSLLVAAVAGGFMALPGSIYPRQESYRYRDVISRLGPAAFAAGLVEVAMLVAARLMPAGGVLAGRALGGQAALGIGLFAAILQIHLIIDLLLPFFPFWGYAGRQVWNWSRVGWVALAIVAAGAIVGGLVLM